jgi:hypothetical protein
MVLAFGWGQKAKKEDKEGEEYENQIDNCAGAINGINWCI